MSAPLKIFIIYAREDRGYKDDLLKSLKLLQTQGLIEPWHDSDIKPGDEWDKEIKAQLRVADIILPIISFEFFYSDYIYRVEIAEAFERYDQGEVLIIPIIAKKCPWEDHPRLYQLQALPIGGRPITSWPTKAHAMDSIYRGIKEVIIEKKQKEKKVENIERRQNVDETALKYSDTLNEDLKKTMGMQIMAEILEGFVASDVKGNHPSNKQASFYKNKSMSPVKGGLFHMGGHMDEDYFWEKPVHPVIVGDFYMGINPVTFEEYDAYCEEKQLEKPDDNDWGRGKNPVININWFEAIEYSNWLSQQHGLTPVYTSTNGLLPFANPIANGYRLPSEAEWEYAARGGQKTKGYKYSGDNNLDKVGWHIANSNINTHLVGQKKSNELGLFDMSGNIREWCFDCWNSNYRNAPSDGSAWSIGDCKNRVVRGGSALQNHAFCRNVGREMEDMRRRLSDVGFRIVCSRK